MSEVNDWDVVSANNNDTPPDGWPENMNYSEVNNSARENMGSLRRMWGDLNGSLQAAGVADAYTVTLNAPYTAYFQGMYFALEINATNTGASTINVNAIGVQSILDRSGAALTAGELQAGGIYELRYDGTNFQLMGTISGGSASLASLTLSNSNDPDLVDTDVALNVGAADPTAAQHLELGPADIQSKSDGTTAAELEINRLGGATQIGPQASGALGEVTLYSDELIMLNADNTNLSGVGFYSADNGDPTTPDNINFFLSILSQDGNQYGAIVYDSDIILDITNNAEGGLVQLVGEQVGGGAAVLVSGDPDGQVLLHQAGTVVARTETAANGGLEVDNQATGAGFERVLTESDGAVLRGWITGLEHNPGPSDFTNDVTVSIGEASDSTTTVLMRLTSALTKQLDVDWAAGNNAGGRLNTGVAFTTGVHPIVLIRNPTTGDVDVGIDSTTPGANLPSGYTQYRTIGWVYTLGASIEPYGTVMGWGAGALYLKYRQIDSISGGTATTTLQTETLPQVPAHAFARLICKQDDTTPTQEVSSSIHDNDEFWVAGGSVPSTSNTAAQLVTPDNNANTDDHWAEIDAYFAVGSTRQINWISTANDASCRVDFANTGYMDPRMFDFQ